MDDSSAASKISLIIPVYNEGDHLERFLKDIDSLELPLPAELVIINDCSADSSKDIIDSFPFKKEHQIVHKEVNEGKGAAIRTGIELAGGSIIGVQDADFEYDYREIPDLLQPLIDDRADVVYGSRFREGSYQVHRTFHYMVNRFLTLLSNLLSGLYLTDMETCYKFFRSDIIKHVKLESNRFGFEPEITAKIARLKVRVMERPISYFPRSYIEGKKITWKDGLAAMRHIVFFNLFQKRESCFTDDLPPRYIPKDWNLL